MNITKMHQTHREQTSSDQWGEGCGEGQLRRGGLRGVGY